MVNTIVTATIGLSDYNYGTGANNGGTSVNNPDEYFSYANNLTLGNTYSGTPLYQKGNSSLLVRGGGGAGDGGAGSYRDGGDGTLVTVYPTANTKMGRGGNGGTHNVNALGTTDTPGDPGIGYGGGGGGAWDTAHMTNGNKGIVCVRYKIDGSSGIDVNDAEGGQKIVTGEYVYHLFTNDGMFKASEHRTPGPDTLFYFDFDNSVSDSSGKGNNPIAISSGIGYETMNLNTYGVLNTTSPVIQMNSSVGNNLTDFAISFWINPVKPSTGYYPMLFGTFNNTDPYAGPTIFYDYDDANTVIFRMHRNNEKAPCKLQPGERQHIVFTRINGTCYAYKNGVLQLSREDSTTYNAQSFYILSRSESQQYFNNAGTKADKYIFESKGWTLDMVRNYFNQTKTLFNFSKYIPNENTLVYYPLTSDLKDFMGNGNTGTVNGTVDFSVREGVKVYTPNGYCTGMSNGIANRDTYTQVFRAQYTDYIDAYGLLLGDSSNYNTNSAFAFELGGNNSDRFRYYNFIGSLDVMGSGQPDMVYDKSRHLWGIVANNGTYKLYKDGVKIGDGTNTGTVNDKPNMNIGYSSYYTNQREVGGRVKDYIVESGSWTDDEMISHFNKTKFDYIVNNNTIAYYPLRNNHMDAYSKNAARSTKGTITFDGKCCSLSGGAIYRDLGKTHDLTQPFTIFQRLKPTNRRSYSSRVGYPRVNDSTSGGFEIWETRSDMGGTHPKFGLTEGSGAWNTNNGWDMPLNERHCFVLVYTGTQLLVYRDCQAMDYSPIIGVTSGGGFTPSGTAGVMWFSVNNNYDYYDGYTAYLGMENKAWTQADVNNFYNVSAPYLLY